MSHLRASCSWQRCSRFSAVVMPALHGHITDSPAVDLLYMWAYSLLCPVLSLNRMTCSDLFSMWKLFDWLKFGCCLLPLFSATEEVHLSSWCGWSPSLASLSVHFLGACCRVRESSAGSGLSILSGRPGQFRHHWDPSCGHFGLSWEQREHLWRWPCLFLIRSRLSLISITAFGRASALKLVEYIPVAVVICSSWWC